MTQSSPTMSLPSLDVPACPQPDQVLCQRWQMTQPLYPERQLATGVSQQSNQDVFTSLQEICNTQVMAPASSGLSSAQCSESIKARNSSTAGLEHRGDRAWSADLIEALQARKSRRAAMPAAQVCGTRSVPQKGHSGTAAAGVSAKSAPHGLLQHARHASTIKTSRLSQQGEENAGQQRAKQGSQKDAKKNPNRHAKQAQTKAPGKQPQERHRQSGYDSPRSMNGSPASSPRLIARGGPSSYQFCAKILSIVLHEGLRTRLNIISDVDACLSKGKLYVHNKCANINGLK